MQGLKCALRNTFVIVMRAIITTVILVFSTLASVQLQAAHIRVEGSVKELHNLKNMKGAYVRLYKDGNKIRSLYTPKSGRFDFKLNNNAVYVIRVTAPGHVTKCFQIDTRGASWVGDRSVNVLKVDMTMMGEVEGFDHSYFDMPLGLAKYNPSTGYLSWSKKYKSQLEPKLVALMEEYNDKVQLFASVEPVK